MFGYWHEEPPVAVLAAAWMGFKPSPKPGERPKLQLVASGPPRGAYALRAAMGDGRAGQQAPQPMAVPEMPTGQRKPGV